MAGVLRRYSNLAPREDTYAKVAALADACPIPSDVEPARPERPPCPKRWTAEAKVEVITLYEDGMSMEAIERQTGYDSMRVRRVLTDAGIEIRPNRHVLTAEVVAELIQLKAGGITNTDLARRYGVSHQSIARVVQRHRFMEPTQ
ncbi:MAG: hypothetical protein QM628_04965 [Propionicimonas sp.]